MKSLTFKLFTVLEKGTSAKRNFIFRRYSNKAAHDSTETHKTVNRIPQATEDAVELKVSSIDSRASENSSLGTLANVIKLAWNGNWFPSCYLQDYRKLLRRTWKWHYRHVSHQVFSDASPCQ